MSDTGARETDWDEDKYDDAAHSTEFVPCVLVRVDT